MPGQTVGHGIHCTVLCCYLRLMPDHLYSLVVYCRPHLPMLTSLTHRTTGIIMGVGK